MIRIIAAVYVALIGAAIAQDSTVYLTPKPVNDQAKIEALKLGYILNGDSMVRWGSIDLTDPNLLAEPRIVEPQRVIPTKKDKRK